MGIFAKIKEATISQGGVYLTPGVYTARIEACKAFKSRKNVDCFVAELCLLKSSNPELPAGTMASWMVTLDKEPALGNIKHFCSVAGDVDPNEVDEAGVEEVVSAANPLKGTIVDISAVNIKTKAGTDFTKCTFMKAGTAVAPAAAPAA